MAQLARAAVEAPSIELGGFQILGPPPPVPRRARSLGRQLAARHRAVRAGRRDRRGGRADPRRRRPAALPRRAGRPLRTPSGQAELSGAEPDIRVRVAANGGPGHLRVRVELTPDPLAQGHWFEFAIDQSYLPDRSGSSMRCSSCFRCAARRQASPTSTAPTGRSRPRRDGALRVLHRFARRRAGVRRRGSGPDELCARLDVGGTTPDVALIERCAASVAIPVFVMIRPRGGDFVYDAGEVAAMAAPSARRPRPGRTASCSARCVATRRSMRASCGA